MDLEQNNEQDWLIIEDELRLIYGEAGYQQIIADNRWRHAYCERRKKLEKQLIWQRVNVAKRMLTVPIFADKKTAEKINRKNAQRARRLVDKLCRMVGLEELNPIDSAAQLVRKMAWHPHHAHIWAVATYPGITIDQLTDCLGITSTNHRMVFRRLNNDLHRVGWLIVSSQIGPQNEPWGWYLEKI